MKLLALGVITVILGVCSARTVRQNQRAHFLGDGSNDVAVNILQSIVGKEKNAVFSPLGYTTILAILTEGARENTRNQLVASLKLPEDTYAVRSTYKRVLTEMSAHDMLNKPEFKNWFYVYKNYTVEESYRSILRDYYLTEVKEVDRYDFPDEDETKKEKPLETGTVTQGESMKNSSLAESLQQVESDESKEDDSKEKSESKEKGSSEEKNSKEKDSAEDKDSSEEKNVKKPSNVMKIKEKVKPIESKDKSPAPISAVQMTDKPEMTESPKESSDGQTEVTTQPDEDSSQQQGASSYPKLDVRSARDTSALSANRLSTMDSERESSLKKLSRMMVFNALYFKGNWSKRFKRTTDKLYPFKVSKTEEKNIEYLQAEDEFETGRIPELDAQALDIPYQGERYSVLVLVPSEEDGLEGLLKKLPGFSFYNIDKQMTKLPTKVCIPKLKFYTISRPTDAFIKSGITDIFNQNADLSGISGKPGLFLEELVQLVTFELDETDSSFNYLTTTEVSELRATPISFKADRPFVFFLRDKVENLNIVSGIVTDPSLQSGGKSSQASDTAN